MKYENSNRSMKAQSARWFIPLGNAVLDSDFAPRKPDVVVVIRDLWEEHVRAELEKFPISNRKLSKIFP